MKTKIFKIFLVICFIIPSVIFCTACLNNNNKDLENKLNQAEVLVLDGVEYKSNEIQAEANKTYYFKVTNNTKIGNEEQNLCYITAYDVNNGVEFVGEKAFGIEGTNAFWEIKVYSASYQKVDFIGSQEHFLVDPMAENFYLSFGDTCYFAVTFTQNVSFVFSFGLER